MSDIITDFYGTERWGGKTVLEVGAGRGTISDLFHIRGCKTTCTDIENVILTNSHQFIEHDILLDRPLPMHFDIVITYGLLEHYKTTQKVHIMWNCNMMLKKKGISIHYVVPKKWTNMSESKDVYRDSCSDLLDKHMSTFKHYNVQHVFPYFKSMEWRCKPFWSKGFIMWRETI